LEHPLNATDPSGYFLKYLTGAWGSLWDDIKPYAGMIVGIAGFMICATCGVAYFMSVGFASGYIGSYVMTGNHRSAFRAGVVGGISAAAFYGIGRHYSGLSGCTSQSTINFGGNFLTKGQVAGQILAHASVGGATAVAQRGKFGHGFVAAGVTKALTNAQLHVADRSVIAGALLASTIGGTVSEMTGGKFRNGANTAAMQFLLNAVASATKEHASNDDD
jgi:hypothetical protein